VGFKPQPAPTRGLSCPRSGPSKPGASADKRKTGTAITAVDGARFFSFNALMQIESLKVYCDLAETESFTKAAQINEVTQSAVSQQISSLERQFKSLLIERSKKKFRLTREGQVLYDYSKQIIQTYDALHSKLQEIKDIISGTIRVATIYSIGLHDLPPYIKRFLKDYPTVHVHVEYRRSNQVYEDVLSNVVDLGLVAYPMKDAKLETVPLRKDPLVLICHPQHPFAKLKTIRLKAIAGQKFIGFEPDIPTRKALDKILKEHTVAVNNVMEFDNIETVKRAVEIDAGISIVPLGTIAQEISKQTLVAVELDDDDFFRPLAAIYKKNKVLSPAMRQFIGILKEGAGKNPAS
jgi:LysR family transcriptional regulator, transcriptional activator of the cysJI operon